MDRVTTSRLSPGLRKIAGNTSWLIAEKLVRMAVGIAVGVWMARYLGPERFGVFNYAVAFAALFAPLATFGIQGIAVRDVVKSPESANEVMGTAFTLRVAGGLIAFAMVACGAALMRDQQPVTRWLVLIVGLPLLFDAFDTIDFRFQAEVESRYAVLARSVGMVSGAAWKLCLILTAAPLIAFGWASVGEALVSAGALVVAHEARKCRIRAWRVTLARAKDLMSQSWPLILSGIGVTLNFNIDKVMLERMSGPTEVGIYSAAARLSEVWYFIPIALASSVFPMLVRSKEMGEEIYNRRLQRLYDLTVWMALAVAVPVSLVAGPLIRVLYGKDYQAAAPILNLHVWACLFTFMGAVLSKWLINEGLLKFSFTRHGAGAVMNIVLNLFMIPRWGGFGAALATVISYATANWLACFTTPATMSAGKMMALALVVPLRAMAGRSVRP